MRILRSPLQITIALLIAGALSIFVTGVVHYGGVGGLQLRLRSAMAAHRPPPVAFLPAATPAPADGEPGALRWDPALIPPSATPRSATPVATPDAHSRVYGHGRGSRSATASWTQGYLQQRPRRLHRCPSLHRKSLLPRRSHLRSRSPACAMSGRHGTTAAPPPLP